MSLIVCKFGGTSVASPERIQMVAKKLIAKKQAGHQVVAVVSAMGKTTDELVGLAASLNDNPPAREMDRLLSTGEQVSMTLLAMAIEARGYKAMSFTGRQAGIETDGTHAKAKIVKVHNERIMEALNRGVIAVVAGFQGIDANGDITTLGRGGSDTTAVAAGAGAGIGAGGALAVSKLAGGAGSRLRRLPHRVLRVSRDRRRRRAYATT